MTLVRLKEKVLGEFFPHLLVLGLCSGLLFISAVLNPVEPQGNSHIKLPENRVRIGTVPLPEICVMKQSIGLPCPGCGLSRSWISLMHFRWRESLAHHRLGPMVFGYVILQILRHLAWILFPSLRALLERIGKKLDVSLIAVISALAFNWIFVLVAWFQSS